ncbi:MAG: hypothetical protein ACOZIN_15535 [Myxococcota bacterium]
MKYELLFQSADAAVPFDSEPVDALLSARGVAERPDGVRIWKLENGEVEVRPLVEGGRRLGTELRLPLSHRLELVREVVVEGAALAAQAKVQLFDPQLCKGIGADDEGLVADQYLRTARYAGEYAGVSEAVDASFAGPLPGEMKPVTKLLLGGAAVLVLLYWLVVKLLGE